MVVTYFHIERDDKRIEKLSDHVENVDLIHTSCEITKDKLVAEGIPSSKIKIVPIGVDTSEFRPRSDEVVDSLRHKLGIPEDSKVIGSFQKDGHGWDEGMEPKLVKGPDVLVEVARRLSEEENIFFLLLGPARGYVKEKLDEYDVPYRHVYVEDYNDVPLYYNLLDLYLVTSRSEGGPKAIPEGLATGTPLVSTRVGMAPDIITHGQDGYLTDIEDVDALVKYARKLIAHPETRERVASNGLETVQSLSWGSIADQLYNEVYTSA